VTSMSLLAEPAKLILGLIAYCSLFLVTIRQNRKNRAVVLGVLTVGMFAGFLFFASLEGKHSPLWLLLIVEALIILLGLGVLTYIASDVWRWASGKSKPIANGNERAGGHGITLK
jgi:4-amino-4-deoxy-L-arabinose transferase-like glycosyltransferase